MNLTSKLSLLREKLKRVPALGDRKNASMTLFFSVSDGRRRARVVHAAGHPFEAVWQRALAQLRAAMAQDGLKGAWLRCDWVEGVRQVDVAQLKAMLKATKRNYFRYGLAFDAEMRTAFIEQELNGNAMLYGGNDIPHAVLNEKNFALYARTRFGDGATVDLADGDPVYILATRGLFLDEHGRCHALGESGPNAGRRQIAELTVEETRALVAGGSAFLARQVGPDGRFVYGLHPCFDREVNAYNALRHASTTYAMIESWEVTRSPPLKAAIERALAYLTGTLLRRVPSPPQGVASAFLVEGNGEIKLGGNAVCLLALAKYTEVFGGRDHLALMEELAAGILQMQDANTGGFVHVLNYPDLSVKEPFRIIYYEGEAAFGLMRLYALTRDPRLLDAVERAFAHFIAAKHWQWHDHWLAYCVNELTRYRPQERYYDFGLRNVATYLDFVMERTTTFPTLLELMMAAEEMVRRLQGDAQHGRLLAALDLDKFYRALNMRAHHLLNGHFWPEFAMFFANPARIAGSFFIRHQAFRVRIDDVEHYLSGLVAYLRYLERRQQAGTNATVSKNRQPEPAQDV